MKKALTLAALSLPLLAFDCGGSHTDPVPTCTVHVRGAVTEDLWCVATAFDYAALGMPGEWAFEIAAYRGPPVANGPLPEIAAEVGVFLAGPPTVGASYGWTPTASTVQSGSASRGEGSVQAGTFVTTHEALAPLAPEDTGTGDLTVRFGEIPAPGATGAALLRVHGTLSGTLAPVDPAGAPATITVAF